MSFSRASMLMAALTMLTSPSMAEEPPQKFLGSAFSPSQSADFARYWNKVTPENAGKWGNVEATRDVMTWAPLDAAYEFAQKNKFPFHMHVMIWGNQQPAWIESLPAAEQLAEIHEWFAAVAARYPDIDFLEVVNEPLHDPPSQRGEGGGNYTDALGAAGATGWDWVINAFRLARKHFPDAALLLNDYSITNHQSDTQRYKTIVELLQAEDLIDGIGVQGHAFATGAETPMSTHTPNLDALASTGLPIYVTELDVDGPTDEAQLADYKRIFPVFWEHPAVQGITLWGYRPGLWRDAQRAYLVLDNGVERPAMKWLQYYVKRRSTAAAPKSEVIGRIERLDPALDAIVSSGATIEKLADGFTWAEGPVWIPSERYLLFTDVPANTLYRWSQHDGVSIFLKPSGYEGTDLRPFREAGANGLYPERKDSILLADSGNRSVSRLSLASRKKTILATHFERRRFNSPNDLVRRADGTIFFTDPPYGLKGLNDSPARELKFNGVFRVDPDGAVHVIDDQLTFPNGIALSPDEKTLYVSNSDPDQPVWMAYGLNATGDVLNRRVFADAKDLVAKHAPGLPDGMAVSADGHLFATAPGGVLVFTPEGRRLGRISTGAAIANCAFGDDGRTLYMTSHHMLARIRVTSKGKGF